uniref:Uncharacterized protein n=1 Tax=Fagus sylvatica TaxID=28930 RepID=A0A2N9JAV3_FAGSY
MTRKKSHGRLAKYVNTPEAMAIFRHHYSIPDDVHLEYKYWEDVLPKESRDLVIPIVAIIEGGVRFLMDPLLVDFLNYFNLSPTQISPNIFRIVMGVVELNRWCPTWDGTSDKSRKHPRDALVNSPHLHTIYDSKVCTDEYVQPRSALLLLHYIPNISNRASGKPLPMVTSSQPEPPINLEDSGRGALPSGATESNQPQMTLLGNMLDPDAPHLGSGSSRAPAQAWTPSFEVFGDPVRSDAAILPVGGGMGAKVASSLCQVARLPIDMEEWGRSTDQEVIDNLRRGLMMGIQGSLILEDRYRNQAEELRRALSLAGRYAVAKKVADGANEKIRLADQKRQEAEESLRIALESNIATEEKIKALEAEMAEREKAAFARGRKEAEMDIAGQLTSIYNESFQEGWKALYAWSKPGELPFLPPRDYLPYPDAPIEVEDKEAEESQSQQPAPGDPTPPSV